MADTGWQYPGTVIAGLSTVAEVGGDHTFSNPNNVKLDNETYANDVGVKMPADEPGEGPELRTSNYGFSVPTTATILGVELKIQGYTDPNKVSELSYLSLEGSPRTVLGTYKTDDWDIPSTSGSPLGAGTHIYGSSTDKWGATLTPTIINGSDFGWTFMTFDPLAPMQMQVDYMQMRVHYTLAATPPIIMMIGA